MSLCSALRYKGKLPQKHGSTEKMQKKKQFNNSYSKVPPSGAGGVNYTQYLLPDPDANFLQPGNCRQLFAK